MLLQKKDKKKKKKKDKHSKKKKKKDKHSKKKKKKKKGKGDAVSWRSICMLTWRLQDADRKKRINQSKMGSSTQLFGMYGHVG